MKFDCAISTLKCERDKWKRALGRLRELDRKKGGKSEYPLHKIKMLELNQAIKILKESEEK